MSLLLAAVLAAAPVVLPSCSWDRPGVNPFMGDVVAAVDRYQDIPAEVRERLKTRMTARRYDEMVSIRRDSIMGKQRYDNQIRDMHFGSGSVCGTVSRARWSDDSQERGLVYCESGYCILVPTVCRNVSRITRRPVREVAAGGGAMSAGDVVAASDTVVPEVAWMAAVPTLELHVATWVDPHAPSPQAPNPSAQPWWQTPAGPGPASFASLGGGGSSGGGGGGGGSFRDGSSPPPHGGPPDTRERVTVGGRLDPRDTPPGPPPITVVPEPASWALTGLGLLLLSGLARRRLAGGHSRRSLDPA